MKVIILGVVVLLAGCAAAPIPVARKFPDTITELQQKCPQLATIEGANVSITDMLKTVVNNYGLYHECANKVDGWNEWYNKQKKNFDTVN